MKQRISIAHKEEISKYYVCIEEYEEQVWNSICVYESEKEISAELTAQRLSYTLSLDIKYLYKSESML